MDLLPPTYRGATVKRRRTFASAAITCLMLLGAACADRAATSPIESPANGSLSATYVLVSENDKPLPEDPWDPYGCCTTLAGSLMLTGNSYELRTSHRNKNNALLFDNSEQGTFTRDGNTLQFTRVSGGGAGYPYLLAPGKVATDGTTITLLYGDEGPGSNQARAVFKR